MRTLAWRAATVVTGVSKSENPGAKTPQGKRFSWLFNVAAISANRHGFNC
jgi:hypothetical protein